MSRIGIGGLVAVFLVVPAYERIDLISHLEQTPCQTHNITEHNHRLKPTRVKQSRKRIGYNYVLIIIETEKRLSKAPKLAASQKQSCAGINYKS